jgi:hypothetical protein
MGLVPPRLEFLVELRRLTEQYGALLIYDEVMTGFRLAYGGAQQLYGQMPDLTVLGKIVGGGLPVDAFLQFRTGAELRFGLQKRYRSLRPLLLGDAGPWHLFALQPVRSRLSVNRTYGRAHGQDDCGGSRGLCRDRWGLNPQPNNTREYENIS